MKTAFVVLVLLAVLVSGGFTAVCHGLSEADATSAVAQADQRVRSCYAAVAAAQKAGANATGLLATLNDAGVLLSEAHLALINGSFDSANDSARQSMQKLDGFEAQALGLQNAAARAGYSNFMFKVVGSIVEAVIVLVGSFVVWSWLKTRQRKARKVVA